MMQCMVQAVPLAAKRTASVGKSAESPAALLQLPHFDGEVLRQLARRKVKTLPGAALQGVGARHDGGVLEMQCACCSPAAPPADPHSLPAPPDATHHCALPAELQQLSAEERGSALKAAGLTSEEVEEVETMLSGEGRALLERGRAGENGEGC